MASLSVFDRTGKEVGSYDVAPTDFAPYINKQLLHDAVVIYQGNLRQGSARTKSRADVAYSTKKLYRQKGTGNARAGMRSSGVRRGGGHIFALRKRNYTRHLPRKAAQLATRMALAAKVRDAEMVIVDELAFGAPKTKEMALVLKSLGCDGRNVLVATAAYDVNVYKSGRNIAGVAVSPASELNALSLLRASRLVVTTEVLDALKARAAANGKKKKAAV